MELAHVSSVTRKVAPVRPSLHRQSALLRALTANIGSHVDITSGWRGHQAKPGTGAGPVSGLGRLCVPSWNANATQQQWNHVVVGRQGIYSS